MSRWTVAALLAFLPLGAVAGLFGPANYDDCILENMKGIADRAAAGAVMAACARRFPETSPAAGAAAQEALAASRQKAKVTEPTPVAPDDRGFTNFVPVPRK